MFLKKGIYLLAFLLVSFRLIAVEIKGTIVLEDDWQPLVFLASLNSPENLFVASPEFIIAQTFINPDGTFSIETNDVSEDARFYRLYLVKGSNSTVEFNTSTHRNYMHLLLDRNSAVEIEAKVENNTFKVSSLVGANDNKAILYFDKEIVKRKVQLVSDITKAKSDFLNQEKREFISSFIDTIPNALVGLYALFHIDDKNTDFIQNSTFYFDFEKQINIQYPNSFYASAYNDLLNDLIGFREMVCEIPGVQPKWKDNLLWLQGVIIVLLLIAIVYLVLKSKKNNARQEEDENNRLFLNLTTKEQQILKLLGEGKTNKEIALELFVELSTVKTHINSIYKQLQLSNRREAIVYCRSLNL